MIAMLEEDWGVSDEDTRPDNNDEFQIPEYKPKGFWQRLLDWLMGE